MIEFDDFINPKVDYFKQGFETLIAEKSKRSKRAPALNETVQNYRFGIIVFTEKHT